MNKKIVYNLMIILVLTLFLSSSVLAFFPTSHKYVFDKSISLDFDSNLLKSAQKYPDLAFASSELVDVSVLYYYTNFQRYSITHSSSFCRSLLEHAGNKGRSLDEDLACSVGGCTHLPVDLVSHNEMVPYSIRHTFLPNSIIHPYSEQHLDNYVESKDPTIKAKVIADMNAYKKCIPLFKEVLQEEAEYKGVNLDVLFDKFVAEIQGSQTGYDTSFKNITSIPLIIMVTYVFFMFLFITLTILLIFKKEKSIFNYISLSIVIFITVVLITLFIGNLGGKAFQTFVFFIKPVSNLVPIGNPEYYIQQSIDNTVNYFKYGEPWLYNKEASGAQSLKEADNEILIYSYIILFIIVTLISLFIYFNLRKSKRRLDLSITT